MSGKKHMGGHHLSRAREDEGWCEALEGLPAVDEAEDAQAQVTPSCPSLTLTGTELL